MIDFHFGLMIVNILFTEVSHPETVSIGWLESEGFSLFN